MNDLYEDLRDGHNLISLLEVLSGETLVSVTELLPPPPTSPSAFTQIQSPDPDLQVKEDILMGDALEYVSKFETRFVESHPKHWVQIF